MNLNYPIPDDLHRALKIRAAEEGITLKALVVRLLSEGVSLVPSQDEHESESARIRSQTEETT